LQGKKKINKEILKNQSFHFSNVVEKCVTYSSREEKRQLIDEVVSFGDG
jgi:hypothetical protein